MSDADLQSRSVELDGDGHPVMYSGTFATTFRLRSENGDVALRCYHRDYNRLERRYEAIGEFLRQVQCPALSRTQYLAHGIRIDGIWWPAVKMDWIPGRTLTDEIEAILGDDAAMLRLAGAFREAVRSLVVLGIAHGDLRPANIRVSGGAVRFIDYDAMFVPVLSGLQQAAFGHRNYQHPGRVRARYDGRLDNFSSLVIYTALVALASMPALWTQFNDGVNVLFRTQDFVSEGRSALFQALLANDATRALARTLIDACRRPIDAVPTLEDAIERSGTATAPEHSTLRLVLPGVDTNKAAQRPPDPAPEPPQHEVRVNRRPRLAWLSPQVGLALTALVGLGIGVGLAGLSKRAPDDTAPPPSLAIVTPVPMPTMQPTIAAIVRPTTAPIVRPSVVPTSRASAAQGTWQINEANVQVGSMVWAGGAALTHNGTLILNAHKVRIAGQPATPCERATTLHAAVTLGAARQTVPFLETNCAGTTSAGEVRLADFAPDQRSFSGTFWENGVRLGEFTASKQ